MKQSILIIGALVLMTKPLIAAEAPTLALGLNNTVQTALDHSSKWKAAEDSYESALARAKVSEAPLLPRLSLDAFYRYQSVVPTIQPSPLAPAIKMGDNKQYSVGPSASWLLFDSGGVYNRWKSAEADAKAKYDDADALKRQIVLDSRLAYFRVQLAREQVRFLTDSLLTIEDQYKDISLQEKAGSLSRMDALQAHQDVLSRQRELRQARSDLALALRDLFYLTGAEPSIDPSLPFDAEAQFQPALEMEPATLLVSQDAPGTSLKTLEPNRTRAFDEGNPALMSLTDSIASAERLVSSLNAEHGPSFVISGRVSRDYPNGPVLETITQKTAGVTASIPIFQGNQVVNEVKAQKKQAAALTEKREDAERLLLRDWQKAKDALEGYIAQRELNRENVKETVALSKLTYESYRAGRSRFLEVEAANLQALTAKLIESRTEVQILMQLSILESLTK